MRIGRRVVKALIWGMVLCLSTLTGGLWFAYRYMTDGETIAQFIRERSVAYFPGSTFDPGTVHLSLFGGKAEFHKVRLTQRIDGALFDVLQIPWLNIRINTRALAKGRFDPREVTVSQPTLRLRHRRDGTWNLDGLLAHPWPGPRITTPPITIKNATLELIPDEEIITSTDAPQEPSKLPLATAARVIPVSGTGAETSESSLASALRAPPSTRGVVSRNPVILRDVSLNIVSAGQDPQRLTFDGTARGDVFDKMKLMGTVDLAKGIITLEGELNGLTLTETLRRRIPFEARPAFKALSLNSGVVDIDLSRFCFDPTAALGSRLRYQALATLRDGVWECPKLPFSVQDLSAFINVEDGKLTVSGARGSNGQTRIRADGTAVIGDPMRVPLEFQITLSDLELDQRLRARTPKKYDDLWDVFKPQGTVDASVHVIRRHEGEEVDMSANVWCLDVSTVYRHFAYPLDHLTGQLTLENKLLTVDVQRRNGAQPVRLKGSIKNPGVNAVVALEIQADSVLIDDALKNAMPPNVRKVIDQFNPSGVVNAHAKVFRKPLPDRPDRPEGEIKIDAEIDLAERCEIIWERLPYPVRNLKGRLEIHPDNWVFRNVTGNNGQATIQASASVEKLSHGPTMPKSAHGEGPLNIRIGLKARDLPFNDELKKALPPEWRKSWHIINPSGSCDIEADVSVAPDQTNHTHIVILPRKDSNVRLEVPRSPQPNRDPGDTIVLPMENVQGRFVFDDGQVTMNGVNFKFRGAPVTFSKGIVVLKNTGQFHLVANELSISEIRFDSYLRNKMPPLMAQFALRLDDGHTFGAKGNLTIGWSGVANEPAFCSWEDLWVVFMDNTVKTGIPLEHIQGEINHVKGWSNGSALEVSGILRLDSVFLMSQQITDIESPFHIKDGKARLDNVKGRFLKGYLTGEDLWVTLDTTPRYHAALAIDRAELEEYARTISGRQSYRGKIAAKIDLTGWGNEVRHVDGQGEAHITEGNLGAMPPLLRLARNLATFLNIPALALSDRPRRAGKTAFDSADVYFTIANGLTTFDPIKFTGNAFSLQGQGTMNPQGNLDLQLNVLWGRDQLHIPLLSDLTREASTPILVVKVDGTPSFPRYDFTPLPVFNKLFQALRVRSERQGP